MIRKEEKNMKKVIALLLVLMMVLSFAACGAKKTGPKNGDKYIIGVCQFMPHVALDAATQGFKDAVEAGLGKNKVEVQIKDAAGEVSNCNSIVSAFKAADVDLIMANATTALQSAYAATADIPIVGTSVTDYVTAGVVDSNEAPGRNVTGVSDLSSIEAQIDVLLQFCAEDTKVAVVYCSAEPNSIYQAELAEAYLKSLGRDYAVYTVADSNEI